MCIKTNCGIYKITNIYSDKTGDPDGRVYVGSSINLKSRKHHHFCKLNCNKHENSYLQSSFNKLKEKYGEGTTAEFFKWEVIEYLELPKSNEELGETILVREQYWIDILNACNRKQGYNLCPTAGSQLGRKVSEETRKKISENSKGNKHNLGRKHTEEHRQKMSEIMKGRVLSSEWKQKISKANKGRQGYWKGKVLSEEAKEKISRANKGYICSEETRKKIKKARKNQVFSEETKKRLSESRPNKKSVKNTTTGEVFKSLADASKSCSLKSKTGIVEVCQGKRRTSGGYEWEYS